MNIIVDGNYVYHKAFSVFSTYHRGQDMGATLSEPDKQQVLIRKCITDMCAAIRRFTDVRRVVVVIDSHSWRYKLYNNYKYALTRVRESYYKQFLAVLDAFEALLRRKGVIVSRVSGAEGDDLIYMWSIYFDRCMGEQVVIITGDSDLRQVLTTNVALFNNDSRHRTLYCIPARQSFWSEYMLKTGAGDGLVVAVNPFETLLYKVTMGDTSDNIPKVKRGFGPKAFERFLGSIHPDEYPDQNNIKFTDMTQWIALRFADFTNSDFEDLLPRVAFNLKMTWLSLATYDAVESLGEIDRSPVKDMTDDIAVQKDSYNYKGEYTLEHFYNMIIK